MAMYSNSMVRYYATGRLSNDIH